MRIETEFRGMQCGAVSRTCDSYFVSCKLEPLSKALVVSLSKNARCLVLVGSRNGFKQD